ncbi:cobyrinate a,c-diamide synthase [Methylobacterium persicinum]|uniref:Hydrogenobyrinate a,c-diamide synthase n=1 Tax=Methylobacterium persicinum TaxID=374426 RepID=A0ABU0HIF4_9HYPH|nr:cobyrinate a,c-diamide synthase [Methylobacterium persicinum]MDQ0441490.1 cobyrinic acid a,c-diamide synthase [Methylobacterium persicinum]GJE39254.1 Hydrogenobyrinate a,c-diamide synthase [Methylobacterium persicinum]
MTVPGLLVAAPRSGSGKTTVTLALMRALRRRGLRIRGMKCGPDYIDPAFHQAATGEPSFNLDSFAMAPALLDTLAASSAAAADLVLAEGSMGLFDGVRAAANRSGANSDIAARYGWPVILVIDVSGAAQSAAAVALGCRAYDPRLTIAGVILNKVASPRHRRLVEDGMAQAGLPVLGALSRDAGLVLPERHLGLVQAGETADLYARLERLADIAEAGIDLDKVVAAAGGAVPAGVGHTPLPPPGQRIAIARDEAFSFLYPHMETGWREVGAELVPFSPLADEPPPDDCDCCWLPGGYPELHAGRIAAARRFLDGTRAFAQTRPVHGECGGYMVLGQAIEDAEGVAYPMLDLLPVSTSYHRRKLHLGYRVARVTADNALGRCGATLIGHEFHYASVTSPTPTEGTSFARIADAEGTDLGFTGHRCGHVTGSFFHLIATGD